MCHNGLMLDEMGKRINRGENDCSVIRLRTSMCQTRLNTKTVPPARNTRIGCK